ncbi:MAG: hypothetical protein A3C85_04115 [Candidatus Doudnabacteria bacterium RIFCSPHIGHO2_02_FULL_48_21]|uniref:Uncharacterized protein n=1 Tax=Candidatus Doudnabacteria bacterium RIFCSPLOWO2_02_FULL_48_13 TaxID=1817845 RepID=A0A1F5QCA7_9BACT|nr:MAG: hypothetical protein A3K05_00800 [Candidatus Doudnabacteria bacterium RIFCSPHIGHO2_01_48_18]OGE78847.1 MAG: hypothetical protein A2668_00515 [Candidatus Doudnabacteria bacterium RIFCSPHIGHO2_01_FULL_48_180]OGE91838.1 MAG: hypothetical protein A3F44_04195 [Candidatus Doudnabacteria bacterium RIFCSPHIGHO2_12_FULL_47_25]OGE94075.1 MAG: hypothetical protein A3C85_04115 [Candidatus Doudnabacteria bacterium RIFCSPHIGHO2_02_FULL_48_21]OGE98219.1 MAG: hypothetical protein A3A83_03560 [Candidatu
MYNDLVEVLRTAEWLLVHGGWIIFAGAMLYMFYELYLEHLQIEWYNSLKWIFLKVTVPPENERSPLAFENIFDQLHSIQETISWAESHLEGQFQIWITWEITSIGGVIGNYIRCLPKHRDSIEAAIYSEFPAAEITEAEDYFTKLPPYDPNTSPYDIFAFTFRYIRRNEYPIKTYKFFEHPTAETMVDPVAGIWEELGKISPYEMFVIQFVLRPIGNDWKEHGYEFVQKLKGVPEFQDGHHGSDPIMGFLGKIIGPFLDLFIRSDAEHAPAHKEEPPSLMLHLTEAEKQTIGLIETKLSHWTYQTKIHCMYVAPKEKYNPTLILRAVIGAFKAFGAANINSLKPYLARWTKVNYYLFKEWEKPITRFRLEWRKRKYFRFMKNRFWFHGPKTNIMSTEELATLIHFPMLTVKVPNVEKVQVKKEQPPIDLPIVPDL